MKKLNKKGFTLIEMLVVIAIIAILVAIIIPVVSAATDKAAAATDAANLRSYKAEIVTAYLSKADTVKVSTADATVGEETIAKGTVTCTLPSPSMKAVKNDVTKCEANTSGMNTNFTVTYEGNEFIVKYQGMTIDDFAAFAENGKWPEGHTPAAYKEQTK